MSAVLLESALHSFSLAPETLALFQAVVQDRCALNGSAGAKTCGSAQTQVWHLSTEQHFSLSSFLLYSPTAEVNGLRALLLGCGWNAETFPSWLKTLVHIKFVIFQSQEGSNICWSNNLLRAATHSCHMLGAGCCFSRCCLANVQRYLCADVLSAGLHLQSRIISSELPAGDFSLLLPQDSFLGVDSLPPPADSLHVAPKSWKLFFIELFCSSAMLRATERIPMLCHRQCET